MKDFLLPLLKRWSKGNSPTSGEWQQLLALELTAFPSNHPFGITASNGMEELKKRSHLFIDLYPAVKERCYNLRFQSLDDILLSLWRLWLPLSISLVTEKENLGRPLIEGILGGQGTGKTTLAEVIQVILAHWGYNTVSISLDDLYKTYAERQALQEQDPRLIWRGPPGTHDITLGIEVLDQLRQNSSHHRVSIPRFDKSAYNGAGDRKGMEQVEGGDIVLFEGWFVGTRPLNDTEEKVFDAPPPPIFTEEDKQFARDNNERLAQYLPLWQRLDRLMILYPVDYRFSQQWRREAEHKMKASGKSGMSDEEINRFVEYFWCALHPELFITPLTRNNDLVNLVVEIEQDHSIGDIYRP